MLRFKKKKKSMALYRIQIYEVDQTTEEFFNTTKTKS